MCGKFPTLPNSANSVNLANLPDLANSENLVNLPCSANSAILQVTVHSLSKYIYKSSVVFNQKSSECGHSVCQNCATQLITALLIICPFCRETTEISDGDDQKLQKNFALVQAIQVMKADSPPKCEEHPYNLAEFVCVVSQFFNF